MKPHCECDRKAVIPVYTSWYSDKERAAWGHAPGKCPCTADLAQYIRDGKIVWLCSACSLPADKRIAA